MNNYVNTVLNGSSEKELSLRALSISSGAEEHQGQRHTLGGKPLGSNCSSTTYHRGDPAKYLLEQKPPLPAARTQPRWLCLCKLPTSYWKNLLETLRLSPAGGATFSLHRLGKSAEAELGLLCLGVRKPRREFPLLSHHDPVSPSCLQE